MNEIFETPRAAFSGTGACFSLRTVLAQKNTVPAELLEMRKFHVLCYAKRNIRCAYAGEGMELCWRGRGIFLFGKTKSM